jgi:hypothetical protein
VCRSNLRDTRAATVASNTSLPRSGASGSAGVDAERTVFTSIFRALRSTPTSIAEGSGSKETGLERPIVMPLDRISASK